MQLGSKAGYSCSLRSRFAPVRAKTDSREANTEGLVWPKAI
jgi:hypothetical protein